MEIATQKNEELCNNINCSKKINRKDTIYEAVKKYEVVLKECVFNNKETTEKEQNITSKNIKTKSLEVLSKVNDGDSSQINQNEPDR